MNEKTKSHMKKVKLGIIAALESALPNVPIYEDEVPEKDTKKYDKQPYRLVVYTMDAITMQANDKGKSYSQEFTINYYSENLDNLDETIVDIISSMLAVPTVRFSRSDKARARHSNSNRYVDIAMITFKRMIPIDSPVRV